MHGVRYDDSHVPVDTRPAVPAAVRLGGVVDAHRQNVRSREVEVRREVEMEAGISVGMSSQLVPVHIHRRVPIDSVKLHADSFAFPLGRRAERLAIPSDAGWKIAAFRARRIVLVGPAFDAPIVREIYRAPGPVRKRARLGAARVAEEESPAGVSSQDQPGRVG